MKPAAWMCTALACGTLALAQAPAPTGATFRTRSDLQLIDVTVMAGRQPVRGLTTADFTVTIDGRPASIVGVEEIAVAAPTPGSSAERALLPDVASNQFRTKRVVILFIDDYSLFVSGEVNALAIQQTREISRRIVADLGPDDLSAVLFTLSAGRRVQTLTTSTPLLLDAIDKAPLFTSDSGIPRGECECGLCSYHELRAATEALRTMAGLRKTIMYVGPGLVPDPPTDLVCHPRQAQALQETFDAARLGNISINTFDPRGLRPRFAQQPITPEFAVSGLRSELFDPRLDFLRNLASNTGGRAVVNTNNPIGQVESVLADGRAYYLVGITPPAEDATRKRAQPPKIEVRVNRRGTNVRVRSGFRPPDRAPAAERSTGSRDEWLQALTRGLLPVSDVPLEVTASPFADADGRPVLAIVLGIPEVGPGARPGQPVDLFVRALDHRGQDVTSRLEHLALPATTAEVGPRHAFRTSMALAPGRYELRIASASEAFGAASVYTHIDVPDFRRGQPSASNLVLTPSASAPTSDVVPVSPLTQRTFARNARVSAFLRVYQNAGTEALVTARVVNAGGATVVEQSLPAGQTAPGLSFADGRAVDYTFPLPLERLAAGTYLVTFRIDATKPPLERTVRFHVE